MNPEENKFHKGNGSDGKHYWLTPPDLLQRLQDEFDFDFDACPFPKPEEFDGLTCEWGERTYVNPPFGSIIHQGKKKGPTAWMRKAIEESHKGKTVVVVYPIDKWILMMIAAGAKISNLGDIKWVATEDGSAGKGTGRHIAQFVLSPPAKETIIPSYFECEQKALGDDPEKNMTALEHFIYIYQPPTEIENHWRELLQRVVNEIEKAK